MNITTRFLNSIDPRTKDAILNSIANHYGISQADAYEEVTDDEAEHLLDYLVEPVRSATSVIMQACGVRGF